eukprot:scaffold1399_cov109-Cylindrotheca_fusiformis.AAC.1
MRSGQQSVSTRSSGVHKPRALRSESGGGKKKKHARGEGGVPVSRPRSAMTTTKKNHTKKRSSDDMDNHTKRRGPVEEDTDDDVSTSSPPPHQMNKNKKRKVSMPIDILTDDDEEEEEQSDDASQETEEAEPATNKDCFRRQGDQGPPNWACQTLDRQEIRDRSPNPPNQTDTTTLLREELRRLQEENNKIKSQLSTTRQEAAQTAWVTPAKNHYHGGQGVAALQRAADTLLVAVRNFATTFVFPKAKFLQTELTARQYCMLAVAKNDIVLPAQATVEQFAEMYHNILDKRVRQIRLNSNTGARVKFIGKFLFSLPEITSSNKVY